ncbi:GTPase-activating protein skywalker-like [Brevipalpus obovatus]|uniref:GTPase-activating protein skywalker-like n=1 Tax=Brevipalpus obovatus TaxID=246614 RepID=UPI003D9F1B56
MINDGTKFANNHVELERCDDSPLIDILEGRLPVDRQKLRRICRKQSNIVKLHRPQLWSFVSSTYKVKSVSTPTFECVPISEFIGGDHIRKLPSFVDPRYCRFFNLSQENQRKLEQILWTLANQHPEITFCPLLYPFAALFLHHYQDVIQTLTSLTYLLGAKSSGIGYDNGPRLMPLTRAEMERQACVLIGLTNKFGYVPKPRFFSKHRKKLDKDDEMDECFMEWMNWIFIGLPFEHVVRIMDCFLIEGTKFLYRIGLVLLLIFKSSRPSLSIASLFSLLKSNANTHRSSSPFTLDSMLSLCEKIELGPDELISAASRLRGITRRNINKLYSKSGRRKLQIRMSLSAPNTPHHNSDSMPASPRKQEMMSLNSFRISEASRLPPNTLKSTVIDRYLLDYLWEWIPERTLIQDPEIIFCTDVHGNSLNTFFTKTENIEQTILLIKTVENEVFGAFCSASWSDWSNTAKKGSNKQYFGTGESFLFSLKPKIRFYPWVGKRENHKDSGRTIPASCQLFMAASPKMITIGAGGGMGIWLDENLTNGKTERCDTFDNEPLCSSREFTCAIIEVIGFS